MFGFGERLSQCFTTRLKPRPSHPTHPPAPAIPRSTITAPPSWSCSASVDDCKIKDEAPVGGCSGVSCPSERDLSTAIASRRLLPGAPGKSNSIVDGAAVVAVGVGSGVAVPTYAPDPYWEFRRSMEEMVVALKLDARKHRAHLYELLLCYLALNRKHAHKYIVGAFTDLLLGLTAAAADE